MIRTIERTFPDGTRVSRPAGGFVLWVELPKPIASRVLFDAALRNGICFAPGDVFSARGRYAHCLRLSCGHSCQGRRIEEGLETIGGLAKSAPSRRIAPSRLASSGFVVRRSTVPPIQRRSFRHDSAACCNGPVAIVVVRENVIVAHRRRYAGDTIESPAERREVWVVHQPLPTGAKKRVVNRVEAHKRRKGHDIGEGHRRAATPLTWRKSPPFSPQLSMLRLPFPWWIRRGLLDCGRRSPRALLKRILNKYRGRSSRSRGCFAVDG